MGAAVAFDRSEVIRLLEARGFEHEAAIGVADVLQNHVLPHIASKRGEASARGRLTARINIAFDQIADIAARVTRIDDRLAKVEETIATTMATKHDLAELKTDLLLKVGAMMVGATVFLTFVQGFFK